MSTLIRVGQALCGVALLFASTAVQAQPAKKDFLWYCESDEATPAQKRTVEEIYVAFEFDEEKDSCEKVFNDLKDRYYLDLYLDFRPISDLSPLVGLENMASFFSDTLTEGAVDTIPPLPNLRWLGIPRAGLKNIPNLDRFPSLQRLDILGVEFNKSTDISNLMSIKRLRIGAAKIEDLGFLSKLEALEDLTIIEPVGFSWDSFPALPKLKNLNIFSIDEVDISVGDKAPNLTWFSMYYSQATSLAGLELPEGITALYLSANMLNKIGEGDIPKNVKALYLDENPIEDHSFITALTKVTHLNLSDSGLSDWKHIYHLLPKMSFLDLSLNPLPELTIPDNESLSMPNISSLNLENTEIASLEFFKRISAPNLNEFVPPLIENKTEANCPTNGVPAAVAKFCKAPN